MTTLKTSDDIHTLSRLFLERAAAGGESPFVHISGASGWRTVTCREFASEVLAVAAGLQRAGLGPGDRLLLVSENRLEWMVADVATILLGAMVVPGYATATPDDWLFLARDCEPRLAVLSPDVARRLGPCAAELEQSVGRVAVFESPSWLDLRTPGTVRDFEEAVDRIGPDDTACILYTSGTGGRPRGVQTTHRNILNNARGATANLAAYGPREHRFMGFLPMSHTYAHSGDLWTPMWAGAQIFLSRGTDHLPGELRHARPTMMNTVPRFWEVMYKRISGALERESAFKQRLFAAAVRTGSARLQGEPLGLVDGVLDRVCERTVRAKVLDRFGGALCCALSAGAPLNPVISTFFNALGIRLHEAYGQTECAPGITMATAGRIVPGTVGSPMEGMEVRLAEDGEILVRGPNVMKGYWNDSVATAQVLRNGWLHTGDIGALEDGLLRITDRKRDFLKTAGGEMVAPQVVEQAMLVQGAVGQALVCGDARAYLAALVVPSDELRAEVQAGRLGRDAVEHRVAQAVNDANHALAPTLRVRRHTVLDKPFEVESGLLTPTLKVKRRAVQQAYAREIEAMYAG